MGTGEPASHNPQGGSTVTQQTLRALAAAEGVGRNVAGPGGLSAGQGGPGRGGERGASQVGHED